MAEKLIFYPEINPIQFVPDNGSYAMGKYNFPHYDQWWSCERLAAWEGKMHYTQKLQQNDILRLQWHSNNAEYGTTKIEVYTNDWQLVTEMICTTTTITGWEITSESSGTTYNPAATHTLTQKISLLNLDDGYYFFVIRVPFSSTEDAITISEPIWIREQHPNTMLIEYYNSFNDFDVFFNDTYNFRPALRVESRLFDLTVNSDDVSYVDETTNVTQTYSKPYNTFTYGVRKVPEWMKNKVNRAFSCDILKLDGIGFTKDKDAKFEQNKAPNNPYKAMTIEVRKARNNYSQSISTLSAIEVWNIQNIGDSGGATAYPFFVSKAQLNVTGGILSHKLMQGINGADNYVGYTTSCKEVRNAADVQVLVDHANNVTRIVYGQTGYYYSVINVDGDISLMYQPSPTETYYSGATNVVLSKRMIVEYESGAYGSGTYFDIEGAYAGYALLRSDGSQFCGAWGNGNPSLSHTLGGNSINLVNNASYIYHYRQATSADTITILDANYSVQTPNIKSIKGKYPASLVQFLLSSGQYATNLDMTFFQACQANIFTIAAFGNGISSVSGLILFAGQDFAQLSNFLLNGNKLTVVAADGLFNTFYNGDSGSEVFAQDNGKLYTYSQTPAAVPTGSSATARTYIGTTRGWDIITD